MNYATDASPLVLDLETAPLPNVRDYLEPPDLSDIKAPKNYVKAEAITEYVEREKANRLAEYAADCDSKAALDFNTARIVALGWWVHESLVVTCRDEEEEAAALRSFWQAADNRLIVGFSAAAISGCHIARRTWAGMPGASALWTCATCSHSTTCATRT